MQKNGNDVNSVTTVTAEVTFYQYHLPSLESGNYKIEVDQTLSSKDGAIVETTYSNAHKFSVLGARFSLNPEDISSVFPPENTQGEYSNVLPHICLTRVTLPWERNIDDTGMVIPTDQTNIPPWMALLVLNEDETFDIQNKTILDLLSPTYKIADGRQGLLPAKVLYPDFPKPNHNELEYGQSWDDPCRIVDLSIDLFNSIAPTLLDVGWLGHVREFEPSISQSSQYLQKLKQISSTTLSPKLATIVANRLPTAGKKSTVLLVSLENWAQFLPNNDGSANPNTPPQKEIDQVRLVVLKQWGFYAVDLKETFFGYLTHLNQDQNSNYTGGTLQLAPGKGTTEEDLIINNALNMGYVPFNHNTRQGDKTVSWYKGPFVPFDCANSISIPVNGADSATLYNPDTGMFDVSYACAFQLGRLLALQNKNFAETLFNWKRANINQVISNFEEEILNETLTEIVAKESINPTDPIQKNINKTLSQILTDFIANKGKHGKDK